jgi:hypothetical protein
VPVRAGWWWESKMSASAERGERSCGAVRCAGRRSVAVLAAHWLQHTQPACLPGAMLHPCAAARAAPASAPAPRAQAKRGRARVTASRPAAGRTLSSALRSAPQHIARRHAARASKCSTEAAAAQSDGFRSASSRAFAEQKESCGRLPAPGAAAHLHPRSQAAPRYRTARSTQPQHGPTLQPPRRSVQRQLRDDRHSDSAAVLKQRRALHGQRPVGTGS